jgi:hypothetical protein
VPRSLIAALVECASISEDGALNSCDDAIVQPKFLLSAIDGDFGIHDDESSCCRVIKYYSETGMPDDEFQAEILRFKELVVNHPVRRVVREQLVAGPCRTLSDRDYYGLREEIAQEWHLHTNEIIIVGSGKLGFSIKESRRFQPFLPTSDYDVAIVSSDLFDYFWRLAFRYTGNYYTWKKKDAFYSYIVRGWMRPDLLPSEGFDERVRWEEFFDGLSNQTRYGRHPIKGGLYKSWEHLEAYHTVCVGECKSILAGKQ